MHFDFVDIGTSDFDIGSGEIEPNKDYLLVEPIEFYLNNIPDKPNILKANYAISNVDNFIDIYYIDEKNIVKYNLPYWVRGCNKVNEKHPTLTKLLQTLNISENIFVCKKVKCITFTTLCLIYNIRNINNLKIDTEGYDHIVFDEVCKTILHHNININKIQIEYLKEFNNTDEIDEIYKKIKHIYPKQNIIEHQGARDLQILKQ